MVHKTHPDPAVSQLVQDLPFPAIFKAVPLPEVLGQTSQRFATDGAD